MQIRAAAPEDCLAIAQMHKGRLPDSFLGFLGTQFLVFFYKSLLESKIGFIIVAEEDKQVVGFYSGIVNKHKFCLYLVKNKTLGTIHFLFPHFFNIRVLRKIFEDFRYAWKNQKGVVLPEAITLGLCVSKEYEGKEIGRKLFFATVAAFQEEGITEFNIVAGSDRLAAQRFFNHVGCDKMGEFELHKGKLSTLYVWKKK